MRKSATLAVFLTALAVVGCGNDDSGNAGAAADGTADGGPITTSSISKAEYVEQADAICAQNTKERFAALTAYGQKESGASQKERLAGAVDAVIIPSIEEEAEELRELGAPAGDEDRIEALVFAFEDVARVARANESLLADPVGEKIREARRLGREYGLTECNFK